MFRAEAFVDEPSRCGTLLPVTEGKRGRETLNQIKTQTDHYVPVVVRRTASARGPSMSGSWAP